MCVHSAHGASTYVTVVTVTMQAWLLCAVEGEQIGCVHDKAAVLLVVHVLYQCPMCISSC